APHAGAWIETFAPKRLKRTKLSHPTRVRGLKPDFMLDNDMPNYVAPHAGAWIETSQSVSVKPTTMSHPTRVRLPTPNCSEFL
ncbi:MAG: hypothetical protein MR865_01910, partial [Bacteroidales bacterium]|nr:hypothetical protein [Bacteroidales bacterium]